MKLAELIRDYLDIEFDGDYDSQTVWVRMRHNDLTNYRWWFGK